MSDLKKVINLEEWKWNKTREHLRKKMLERYGSDEEEWEAFVYYNKEGCYTPENYPE